MPQEVIERSQEILELLKIKEAQLVAQIGGTSDHMTEAYVRLKQEFDGLQRAYAHLLEQQKDFAAYARLMQQINFDDLSPKRAFDLLWELKGNV